MTAIYVVVIYEDKYQLQQHILEHHHTVHLSQLLTVLGLRSPFLHLEDGLLSEFFAGIYVF